jgi:dTDP-4-dehydrorhamnose reductase
MKVMILGSRGMAGHMLMKYLAQFSHLEVIGTHRDGNADNQSEYSIDVRESSLFERLIKFVCPDVVINCTGVLVKASEKDPDQAIFINSYLPNRLAKLSRECGFRFIHLSSDCVFDSELGWNDELSKPNGTDMYARTKIMGEVGQDRQSDVLTLRTSIIGPELNNRSGSLLEWFKHSTGTVRGYAGAYWNGLTTLELAQEILNIVIYHPNLRGLYHLAKVNITSKLDLLKDIKQVFDVQTDIETDTDFRCNRILVNTRTDYSMLSNTTPYIEALRQLKKFYYTEGGK